MFIAVLFTVAKIWKQPKCLSTDEWIKKMRSCYIYTCIHTHIYIHAMEYYSTLRKKEILLFVTTWMDLEGIMLSKISQAKKDILYGIT